MAEAGSGNDIDNILEDMDAVEIDGFKAALAAMLIESTVLDADAIYSLVFESGRKITWC